ncbi:hypothetical protein [Zhengella mangrovi]|uniref:hypothetical protein n=1 Tax=Zhengella mangrovi TaxID=1982044 RepID=UPI0010542DFF|nr:hypothetical protein [Zhengella mangrovi]
MKELRGLVGQSRFGFVAIITVLPEYGIGDSPVMREHRIATAGAGTESDVDCHARVAAGLGPEGR